MINFTLLKEHFLRLLFLIKKLIVKYIIPSICIFIVLIIADHFLRNNKYCNGILFVILNLGLYISNCFNNKKTL